MNIETVNELIQSLESAGELSIKETKVMALAKAYQQLAAENVGMKAGVQAALDEMESHHDTDALYSYDADGEPMDALIRLCDAQGTISDLLSMNETPATDRIVAGIKADEEKAVLNDLLRHLDKIDIENLSSPWELSSEVVAFVNSRLLREEADK
ncbi:hypothetical protein [Klebsiella michiganensis]|uniref:hypothetical protein n=1 Tax=Klebsiella michiganensis TaxID=1134687 RepID=UPI002596BD68|nr:hypothetical protein [Klebsiella michiganensis]MDM4570246.1 hypothetical protein [Klebsiella michiganensis]MDM4587398.1 hypothetical protein [Klebsiella michiganensis]